MSSNRNQRLYGMLGFAMRAGKLIIGTEQICTAMASERKRPLLVLISESASDATKKKLTVKAQFYGIESLIIPIDTDTLGVRLGKTFSPAAVAVTDEGFSKELRAAVGNEQQNATKGSFPEGNR